MPATGSNHKHPNPQPAHISRNPFSTHERKESGIVALVYVKLNDLK